MELRDAVRPRFAGGGCAASVSSLTLDNVSFTAEARMAGGGIKIACGSLRRGFAFASLGELACASSTDYVNASYDGRTIG